MTPTDTPDEPTQPPGGADPARHARFAAILRRAGLVPLSHAGLLRHEVAHARAVDDTAPRRAGLSMSPPRTASTELPGDPGLGWLRAAHLARHEQARPLQRDLLAALEIIGERSPDWGGRLGAQRRPEGGDAQSRRVAALDGVAAILPGDPVAVLREAACSPDATRAAVVASLPSDMASDLAETLWGAGQAALLLAQLTDPGAARNALLIRRCAAWRARVADAGHLSGSARRAEIGLAACDRLLASLRLHALLGLDAPLRGDGQGEPLPRDPDARG